jgi:DNA-binding NtrC family response regulator
VLFCDDQRISLKDLTPEVRGEGRSSATPMPGTVSVPPGDPSASQAPSEGGLRETVRAAMARLERELIVRALAQTGGNVTRAARLLKISRKGLQLKMKELGLREPQG